MKSRVLWALFLGLFSGPAWFFGATYRSQLEEICLSSVIQEQLRTNSKFLLDRFEKENDEDWVFVTNVTKNDRLIFLFELIDHAAGLVVKNSSPGFLTSLVLGKESMVDIEKNKKTLAQFQELFKRIEKTSREEVCYSMESSRRDPTPDQNCIPIALMMDGLKILASSQPITHQKECQNWGLLASSDLRMSQWMLLKGMDLRKQQRDLLIILRRQKADDFRQYCQAKKAVSSLHSAISVSEQRCLGSPNKCTSTKLNAWKREFETKLEGFRQSEKLLESKYRARWIFGKNKEQTIIPCVDL